MMYKKSKVNKSTGSNLQSASQNNESASGAFDSKVNSENADKLTLYDQNQRKIREEAF